MCGAIAGGTAAAITTPLDVAKTRIMLAKASHSIRDLRIIIIGDCSGAGNQTCFSTSVHFRNSREGPEGGGINWIHGGVGNPWAPHPI